VNVACLDALARLAADMPDNVDSYWIVRQVIWSALRDRGPERNQFLAAAIERLPGFGKTPAAALADRMSRNQTPDVYTRRRLFSILKRLSPEMREPATRVLHQIAREPADPLRLDALCELIALGADDAYVRAQLLRIGVAPDPDVSPMDRERALDVLASRRPDEQVLRELVTKLEDDTTGDVAGKLLVRYGPAARTAIVSLAGRVASTRSIAAKRRMVSLLGSLGPGARDAVPVIAPLLRGGYQSLRLAAMNSLAQIGPDARSAVPQLLPLLRDSSPVIRGSAAYALVRIAPEDERLAAELVRAARSNDWMLCVVLSPSLRAARGAGDSKADLANIARRDPNVEIRAVAYYALRDLGVSLPWLYPERRAGE
jgi:HEAT repeat protein